VHWSVELANAILRNSVQMEVSNQFTLMILLSILILVLLRKLFLTGDLVIYLIILLRINLKLIQQLRCKEERICYMCETIKETQSSAFINLQR
jgi:hypothetical protein